MRSWEGVRLHHHTVPEAGTNGSNRDEGKVRERENRGGEKQRKAEWREERRLRGGNGGGVVRERVMEGERVERMEEGRMWGTEK